MHRVTAIKLRDTLRLAQEGDYSYKEMSAMLCAPTGTIKSRMWVARRLVARQLRRLSWPDRANPI